MNVRDAIEQFILWRRSLGAKFVTGSSVLRHFLKGVDGGVGCDEITPEQVRAFIAGAGPLTQTRALKYSVLAGFYRYAISRGHASRWPLPDNEPKPPRPAPPYVYSREEVRRLLDGLDLHARHALQIDADTMRTLILLLYGAGLRGGEARRLTLADVDLKESVLTVRRSKFFKTRLVPVGPPGTLADSVHRFAALFEPVAQAILAHQNGAAVRHGDETGWRVQSLREQGRSSRAWLWTSVSADAVYFHMTPRATPRSPGCCSAAPPARCSWSATASRPTRRWRANSAARWSCAGAGAISAATSSTARPARRH